MKKIKLTILNFWHKIFWDNFKKLCLTEKVKVIRDISVTLLTFMIPILIFVMQIKHDENNLKPYINLNIGKHKSYVSVELENAGLGPAVINNVILKQNGNVIEADNLYDAINWEQQYSFTYIDGEKVTNQKINKNNVKDYMINFINDTLSVGNSLTLLYFEPNETEITDQIRLMRYALLDIEIIVEYSDIYGNSFVKRGNFDTFKPLFL